MMLVEVVKIVVLPLLVFYPVTPLHVINVQKIILDRRRTYGVICIL